MAERKILTRHSVSSLSSVESKDHISLLEKIRNIFSPPRVNLQRRIEENDVLTTGKKTRPFVKRYLTSEDIGKPEYGCKNGNERSYEVRNKTQIPKWQEFDESEAGLNYYGGPTHVKQSTYICENETMNPNRPLVTLEKTNLHSASDLHRTHSGKPTHLFPSLHKHDEENFQITENNSVDSIEAMDADIEDEKIDSHKMTVRNGTNELVMLSKDHNDLKRLFVITIILFVCVIMVLSVVLVTTKLTYERDMPFSADDIKDIIDEHLSSLEQVRNDEIKQIVEANLSSTKGKQSIRTFINCVPCTSLDKTIAQHFVESGKGECCIKDITLLLKMISELNDKTSKECASKLNILERNQTNMLSFIADLQMKVFDEDVVVAKEWPKHPGIKKNNVLINSLLTRRRSAIHLTGNIKNGVLQWSSEMSEGTLSHLNDVIYVQNGGMYVVYCIIRFKKDACGPEGKVGYTIKHRSDMGPVVQIASVYKNCFNETYYNTELFIQKSFKLSVGQNSDIYFDIGNLENNLIDKDSQQSFGVFEL